MFDYTVFIGRFQPIHFGHLSVIKQALAQSRKLIILVGSANRARDIRNPFIYRERVAMVESCLTLAERSRIFFHPLNDYMYQDTLWVENVQSIVERIVNLQGYYGEGAYKPSIALIGHSKDATGFFLKLFPQWESLGVKEPSNISSTNIRKYLFGLRHQDATTAWEKNVPECIFNYLDNWAVENPELLDQLQAEFDHVQAYKKQWASAPYPVIFQTVDNVVIQSGHVLLVRRGAMPGEGLLALPGGFVNQGEFLIDAAIRELYEETKIKVPEKVLRGSLKDRATFDDPYRSTRGRTITHSFFWKLPDSEDLPKVKGSDDAKSAEFLPLAKWRCKDTFEDHWFQGQYFKDRDRLKS